MLIVSFSNKNCSLVFCKENNINYPLHMFCKMIHKFNKCNMENKTVKPN